MSSLLHLSVAALLLLFQTADMVPPKQVVLYFFYRRPHYPRDCKEAVDSCHYQRYSGVYVIKPDGYNKPFEVYCDNTLDSDGWTVILRRLDGSVTFQRDWLDYKLGFGFLSQELWLGHEKVAFLTNQNAYELRIDYTYSDGTSIYALYTFFRISDGFSNYKLTSIGLYTGTADFTTCPPNMDYGTCSCQTPCGNPQDCVPCSRGESCFCPRGFYIKGEDCVRQEECGCFIDGNTIGEWETYINPSCTKRCMCIIGQLVCDNSYRCSPNAVCDQRDNVLQCYCNDGFRGNGVNCSTTCPTNTIYGTCLCQTLCAYPQVCLPCSQGEMCYCPGGFYIQGGNCVPQEECGCYVDGNIIQEGESYTAPGCSKRCICINGQLTCDNNYQCSPNAVCSQHNNMNKCKCNPGFAGDGVICCSANKVYGTCVCEASCGYPQVCETCTQIQRCYCPSGFFLQGQECIRQEECGCYIDGIIVQEGESYTALGCSKRCSCTTGKLSCDYNYQCSPNAVCVGENNVYQCICNPGYTGDGVICLPICSTNEVYGTCICEATCGYPEACTTCTQIEQCYCPRGFYLQGQECLRQEECGCYTDGIMVQNGETYVNSDCSERCTCNNDHLNCNSDYECSPNAACRVEDGVRQCYCNDRYEGDGETCTKLPARDCNDIQADGHTQDGVYSIRPTGWSGSSFNVFCNMTIDGGRWTVIQRRVNGNTDFYRNWVSYRNGFGNLRDEFWLGNEKIYFITQQASYEYRADTVYSTGTTYYDKYSSFRIDNEVNKYRVIDVGSKSGNGGKSLENTLNIEFSTYDQDNDRQSYNCAEKHHGAWWYGGLYIICSRAVCHCFVDEEAYVRCTSSNLNGDYEGFNGIFDLYCSIKYTEMKIRRIP